MQSRQVPNHTMLARKPCSGLRECTLTSVNHGQRTILLGQSCKGYLKKPDLEVQWKWSKWDLDHSLALYWGKWWSAFIPDINPIYPFKSNHKLRKLETQNRIKWGIMTEPCEGALTWKGIHEGMDMEDISHRSAMQCINGDKNWKK